MELGVINSYLSVNPSLSVSGWCVFFYIDPEYRIVFFYCCDFDEKLSINSLTFYYDDTNTPIVSQQIPESHSIYAFISHNIQT